MKNGILNLRLFDVLDRLRKRHKIKDIEWAEKSDLKYSSRISELRKMANHARRGEGYSEVGRAFPVGKAVALINGLKVLVGGNLVKKELLEAIENAKTNKEEMILMILALDETDENQVKIFLKAVLNRKE